MLQICLPSPTPHQKSLVFSQLSFYLYSVKCQGLNPDSFLPHSSHQQLWQISPWDPLLPGSIPTTFTQSTVTFSLAWVLAVDSSMLFLLLPLLPPANPTPNKQPAVSCSTYRSGHVILLHKMLQFHLMTFENFQLRTLLSASPSNFISSHSPLNCSHWIQIHCSPVLDLNRLALAGMLFSLNFLKAGYFLSFRYQSKCHLFRELISGSH